MYEYVTFHKITLSERGFVTRESKTVHNVIKSGHFMVCDPSELLLLYLCIGFYLFL